MEFITSPPFKNHIDASMSWEDYKRAPGINPSRIVKGIKSMKSFKNYGGDDKPDRGLLVGSITHLLIFEPDTFYGRYAIFNGQRREDSKKYQLWKWKNEGKEAVSPDAYDQARRTADAVRNSPEAMELIEATQHEVSLFLEDFGMQCRGRVDGLQVGKLLLDLKTTTNVEPHAFGRIFARLHYAEKMSCYKRWVEKLTGADIPEVKVIAVETKDDYDVTVFPIREPVLENAWPRAEKILQCVRECIEEDSWPGVGAECELVIPNYAMDDEDVLEFQG